VVDALHLPGIVEASVVGTTHVMPSPLRRFDRWLFEAGDAKRLAAIRIGLFALLAARLSRGMYVLAVQKPAADYHPVSFMHLFATPPPGWSIAFMQTVGIIACVLAAVGWRTRMVSWAAWVSAAFVIGTVASYHHDAENEAMLMLALVPLLFAHTADCWSLDSWKRGAPGAASDAAPSSGWPVRAAMIVVAGAYFFSGLPKLVWSGASWVTSSNLRWILYTASDLQHSPNRFALFIANRPPLAHALAGAALATELLFFLVLIRPTLKRIFLPAVVALHAAIWATIGLDYMAWAATAVIVYVDWPGLMERMPRLWAPSRQRLSRPTVATERAGVFLETSDA
jgi:hypothetical protein